MPYMTSPLENYTSCTGANLYCANRILNKISDYKTVGKTVSMSFIFSFPLFQIFDPFKQQNMTCYESCDDQQHSVQTTTSKYPAETTFTHEIDYCLLLIKFVDQCKIVER